jgi:hypothetical protein
LLKLTSHIIGLELELLQGVDAKEKNIYNLICILYLSILLLATLAGAYLFYMIDDHLFSIILGGVVFVFLFSAIFRVILITNRDSILDTHTSISKIRNRLPSMSGLLRFVIACIFAVILAFPIASAANHKMVIRISKEKTAEIKGAMNGQVELLSMASLKEDLKHTHFPLTVFEELTSTKKIIPWLMLILVVILTQQTLLARARRGKAFLYQSLAKEKYVRIVSKDYRETIEHGFALAQQKFNADLSKEIADLDRDDMYPPFKVIPNTLEQDYLDYDKKEETTKKALGL